MRVLLVGINYSPESAGIAPYTTGFAEHLVDQGHEVDVLAGVPHYPNWRTPAATSYQTDEVANGVHVYRRRHYVPSAQSALQRAMYEGSFLGSIPLLMTLPTPDAIVGVVPTLSDAVLASIAGRRFGVPYGLLFQDLVSLAAVQTGIRGGRSVAKLVRGSEGLVARQASRVGIVSEGFRPHLESLGVPAAAIDRLHNWTQIPTPSAPRPELRRRLGWAADAFVVLYAGSLGLKQGLENILETARLAATTNPTLRFVLAGDGNQRRALEAAGQAQGLTNLAFLPSLPQQEYADLLAAADVLLLNQAANVKNMAFPSKLSSYVVSGRPIIAAVAPDCDVHNELAAAEAALLVAPDRPASLLEAIERLNADELLRQRLTDAARRYGRSSFAREAALAELEAFVISIAQRGAYAGAREGVSS